MTNYYEILNIPNGSSKQRAFRAFKQRYLKETKKEVKIDLMAGLLIVINERHKFLDILLGQYRKGRTLTPKYNEVIAFERKKAESVINNPKSELQVIKALKVYPFRESISGLLHVFIYTADRHYFEVSYVLILIGIIMMFQSNQSLLYVGLTLIIIGIYAHIRIVRNVKINKIKKITTYNNK